MPSDPTTVRMWVIQGKHPEFSAQYAQAREAQADHYFEEIFEISDDGSNDWMERNKFEGDTAVICDHEHVNRSRLRVDTRKWALARMSPKKYGALAAGEVPVVNNTVSASLSFVDSLKREVQSVNRLATALTNPTNGANGHA